jgi:thiol-disulfide isomerase/thioredoxin
MFAYSPYYVNSLLFRVLLCAASVVAGTLIAETAYPQQRSALEKALRFKPTQSVEIDVPTAEEAEKCSIKETDTAVSKPGWIVLEPTGRVIRRFLDTNGDSNLDQLGYFRGGIEVYRDIDSDFDKKFDQMRWLGPAGSRWGIDKNQDGKIDSWKFISAEEVSSEIVEAIKTRDADRFAALLITEDEIGTLELGSNHTREITERSTAASGAFKTFIDEQKLLDTDASWVHFGGLRPGVIPAGTEGSGKDVTIYDSVTAVVASGDKKHGQLSIGTLILVNNAWRVVDTPELIVEGKPIANGGMFYQVNPATPASAVAGSGDSASEEEQELYAAYEELDAKIQKAAAGDLPELNQQRAELFMKMALASQTAENRSNWIRQLADVVGNAYRNGEFPDGNSFLQEAVSTLAEKKVDKSDVAYVEYRRLSVHNSMQLDQATSSDYEKLAREHLQSLRDFVEKYPTAEPSADAMLQIGLQEEFDGNFKEAGDWYRKIATDFGKSDAARKARGAALRLDSEGKAIPFTGTTLDNKKYDLSTRSGRVVLLQYWATWCEPCKDDLRLIKQAYEKYRSKNFEVVSISLDTSVDEVRAFLKSENLPWIHLFEEGGLDSPLADQLGVSVVPTMILVGADGKVIDRNLSSADLDKVLSRQFRSSDKSDDKSDK